MFFVKVIVIVVQNWILGTNMDSYQMFNSEALDGFGRLGRPPEAAQGLEAGGFGRTPASPRHPPGLYGPENGRRALNLGAAAPKLEPAPMVTSSPKSTWRT